MYNASLFNLLLSLRTAMFILYGLLVAMTYVNERTVKHCKRVFTMNKNDVFLDKVQMRNTSNCLYVCRTLDYVANIEQVSPHQH